MLLLRSKIIQIKYSIKGLSLRRGTFFFSATSAKKCPAPSRRRALELKISIKLSGQWLFCLGVTLFGSTGGTNLSGRSIAGACIPISTVVAEVELDA